MNNAGCCSVPGHWTQLSAYLSSIYSHSLFYYNTPIFMYHHASPLPLCPQFIFVPRLPVIHFISSLCLCPCLIASPPSQRPFSFGSRLCSSVKALRNYSQWFFFLFFFFLPPLPGREWASAWLIGCQPRRLQQRVSFPIKSHTHCC